VTQAGRFALPFMCRYGNENGEFVPLHSQNIDNLADEIPLETDAAADAVSDEKEKSDQPKIINDSNAQKPKKRVMLPRMNRSSTG